MLEEVIQDEIIDETDTFESNEHNVPVVRRPGRDRPDVSSYLALFEHKIRDQNRLSPPEVQAVSAFLLTAIPEFAIFASVETVLKVCIQQLLSRSQDGPLTSCKGTMGIKHAALSMLCGMICRRHRERSFRLASKLSPGRLQGLVRQAEIIDTEASDNEDDNKSGSSGPEHQLYTSGQRSHHFTLVLQVCAPWLSPT